MLAAANMPQTYWPYAVRDIAFKQSLLVHRYTGDGPFTKWHGRQVKLPVMFEFGQLGYMPKLRRQGKITDRSVMERYMGMADMRHVNAQMQNGKNVRCRAADLHPVYTATDTNFIHRMVF